MKLADLDERATISVEEAARWLGISRGVAYDEARRYETTGGKQGLPVVRFGRRLLVPTYRLKALLGADAGLQPVSTASQ